MFYGAGTIARTQKQPVYAHYDAMPDLPVGGDSIFAVYEQAERFRHRINHLGPKFDYDSQKLKDLFALSARHNLIKNKRLAKIFNAPKEETRQQVVSALDDIIKRSQNILSRP